MQPPFVCHIDYMTKICEIQIVIQELNMKFEDVAKFKGN